MSFILLKHSSNHSHHRYDTFSSRILANSRFNQIQHSALMTTARVRARLDRVATGNFGDSKSVGDGVFELRFTVGAGIRVYYGLDGEYASCPNIFSLTL